MVTMANEIQKLKEGLDVAFIDNESFDINDCTPDLIYNDAKNGIKVSTDIIDELMLIV